VAGAIAKLGPHAGAAVVVGPPPLGDGLHQEEAEATALPAIESHGSNGNVTGLLDLQAQVAIADLDIDAYRCARSQLRVTHAVGHELGDEQLRIIVRVRAWPAFRRTTQKPPP
jgi:hypothetical protein